MEQPFNIRFTGRALKKGALVLFMLPMVLAAQEKGNWLTNMDQAMAAAKKDNKHILVYFTGSDWCPPCKKLKTDLFDTPDFQSLSKDYILLYVDYPRNRDLITGTTGTQQNVVDETEQKKVFPLFKVLNGKGRPLDEYTGYSMSGDVSYILRFLEENR